MKQKTIAGECVFSGQGLHTGCAATMVLKPSGENTGIRFVRTDLPGAPVISATSSSIVYDQNMPRCTAIGNGPAVIYTVEHFMSVLCGLGISNLTVEINGNEIPGLDGSGIEFLKGIKKAGVREQTLEQQSFKIQETIGVEMDGSSICVVPADDFKISYVLDYDHPLLRSQFFSAVVDAGSFEREIAPCRTFCLEKEVEALRSNGLGKGATYQNTLVVGDKGVVQNKTRFSDEFARHKVLDFIGDLYLLGLPICGHVYAVKSGHALNIALLKKILKQKEQFDQKGRQAMPDITGKKEIDINGIMKILPHRYPFLLVDRVIEIEQGKKAVGIKNVTMNEPFFPGHFPTRPVMPGVLMIEAMAQVSGVVILTSEEHQGKVAFFMAVDKVKFRKVVSPGDQLVMEIEVLRDKSRFAQVRGISKVNGDIVAEAEMMFSFTDASYLNRV